jgi:L-glyceraldehyde 3-phosphate reductase
VPTGSRASRDDSTLSRDAISEQRVRALQGLNDIAARRGQSLAQMAVSWVLRDPRVTSVVVGASSVGQLEENVAAVEQTEFSDEELSAIDALAIDDPDVDLWRAQSRIGA